MACRGSGVRVPSAPPDRRRPVLSREPAFDVCPWRLDVEGHWGDSLLEAVHVRDRRWRHAAAGRRRIWSRWTTPGPAARVPGRPDVRIVHRPAHGVRVAQVFRAITLEPALLLSMLDRK